jgi:hypothetical protein
LSAVLLSERRRKKEKSKNAKSSEDELKELEEK